MVGFQHSPQCIGSKEKFTLAVECPSRGAPMADGADSRGEEVEDFCDHGAQTLPQLVGQIRSYQFFFRNFFGATLLTLRAALEETQQTTAVPVSVTKPPEPWAPTEQWIRLRLIRVHPECGFLTEGPMRQKTCQHRKILNRSTSVLSVSSVVNSAGFGFIGVHQWLLPEYRQPGCAQRISMQSP